MAAFRWSIGLGLIFWWSADLAPAADVSRPRTDAHGDPLPPGRWPASARCGFVCPIRGSMHWLCRPMASSSRLIPAMTLSA